MKFVCKSAQMWQTEPSLDRARFRLMSRKKSSIHMTHDWMSRQDRVRQRYLGNRTIQFYDHAYHFSQSIVWISSLKVNEEGEHRESLPSLSKLHVCFTILCTCVSHVLNIMASSRYTAISLYYSYLFKSHNLGWAGAATPFLAGAESRCTMP